MSTDNEYERAELIRAMSSGEFRIPFGLEHRRLEQINMRAILRREMAPEFNPELFQPKRVRLVIP